MPAWGKYEISTYPLNFAMLHIYEAIIIIIISKILMQVL